jgi:GNAT superfamily N-acetyltransferase
MRLSFVAATTDQHFRDLLIVRNECRDGLTHDTKEITLEQQQAWKSKCWPETSLAGLWYEPYLLYDEEWPIGYGLLKWDGAKYWMTAGLAKAYRGKGLSQLLITFITEMGYKNGKTPVWLDAKDDNPGMFGYIRTGYEFPEVWIDVMDDNPALYGDIRAGYEFKSAVQYGENELHIMKHNRNRRLGPKEAGWMRDHGKSVEGDIAQEMIEVDEISRNSANLHA